MQSACLELLLIHYASIRVQLHFVAILALDGDPDLPWAFCFPRASEGKSSAARIVRIAITTSNSTSVNAPWFRLRPPFVPSISLLPNSQFGARPAGAACRLRRSWPGTCALGSQRHVYGSARLLARSFRAGRRKQVQQRSGPASHQPPEVCAPTLWGKRARSRPSRSCAYPRRSLIRFPKLFTSAGSAPDPALRPSW
jgi:hypothetical protein